MSHTRHMFNAILPSSQNNGMLYLWHILMLLYHCRNTMAHFFPDVCFYVFLCHCRKTMADFIHNAKSFFILLTSSCICNLYCKHFKHNILKKRGSMVCVLIILQRIMQCHSTNQMSILHAPAANHRVLQRGKYQYFLEIVQYIFAVISL